MIIDNLQQNNIQTVGDIKEFKTSIDPKNLNFITTLLSSNLYSNPEQSFIREIVSNAWDSHVEANTTNVPVIIKFTKVQNDWEISIRDFGTGLSPERFKNIFCNIGSSTKRESNKFIGGFGLGRFSALACSNTVYITSYYEGIAYYYIMVKSGNVITNNLILQKETTEKNGVEITIKKLKSLYSYTKVLECITFFPNVYISGIDTDFNDIKIKRFTNFAAASTNIKLKFLLGNVLYPYNDSFIDKENKEFMDNIKSSGIVITFDIGELEVTPNRESIIYTTETIKKINDKIKAAREEIKTLIKNKVPNNCDNLYEYYDLLFNSFVYDPIKDIYYKYSCREERVGYKFHFKNNSLTFKHKILDEQAYGHLVYFFISRPINVKGFIYNNKFYQNKTPIALEKYIRNRHKKIIILNKDTRFTKVLKDWLYENYNNYIVITSFTKEEFSNYIFQHIIPHHLPKRGDEQQLVNYMYEYFMSNAKVLDLNTNVSFQEYAAKSKAQKIHVIKQIKEFIIYEQQGICFRRERYFKTLEEVIKWIKSLNKGVVLLNMKDDTEIYNVTKLKNYVLIKAKKEIVNVIKKTNLKCLVDKENLFKDKKAIKLNSILQVFNGNKIFPSKWELKYILKTIPVEQQKQIKELVSFYYTSENYYYKSMVNKNCNKVDNYTLNLCKKLQQYVTIYRDFCHNHRIPYENFSLETYEPFIIMAIVKCKLYRVNYLTYKSTKNNSLIKILCEK